MGLSRLSWHTHPLSGVNNMSKEQKGNKESKKKPAMSPKEKKAAKKAKKDSNSGSKGLLD
jgi:hypothetical protein